LSYSIGILRTAQKQLLKIDRKEKQKIIVEIRKLAENPRPVDCRKLTGREAFRIRVGSYRVIYEINDKMLLILIVAVGHRKEVYR
jgi:mRNA interferase RelE/StbE